MGIAAVCLAIVIFLLLRYFYFGTSAPKRTCSDMSEGTKNEIISTMNADDLIKDTSMRVSDKSNVIFLTMEFNETASLDEARSKAVTAYELFSEDQRACLDFQFILIQSPSEANDGFTIMGSRNVRGTNFVWNNNNVKVSED